MAANPREVMNKRFHIQLDIIIAPATVFLVLFFDRITKYFFSQILSEGQSLPIIRNVFHMSLVHNTGIAFGLFKDQGIVFIIIPVIAIVLLVYNIYYYRNHEHNMNSMYVIGFSLILAGALGNLIDRVVYGYVIDFFDFRIWPVFNIADMAITVGALLIAWKCLRVRED